MANRVLDIQDLHVSFDTYAGEVKAVRGVTLHVDEGEVLAIVGESGCGKSVTAQTIMKLNPMPPARIVSGTIDLVAPLRCTRSVRTLLTEVKSVRRKVYCTPVSTPQRSFILLRANSEKATGE